MMNVSGHRIGTMEVESALVSHTAVAESAVIGRHDEDKGQAIVAYVILEGDRRAPKSSSRSSTTGQKSHRSAREAGGGHLHPRPSQDEERQDHAPRAARCGRRRRRPRRHLDPRRPVRRRRPQGGPQPELAANGESHRTGGAFQAPPRFLLAQGPSLPSLDSTLTRKIASKL